jgi:hypothetical protein
MFLNIVLSTFFIQIEKKHSSSEFTYNYMSYELILHIEIFRHCTVTPPLLGSGEEGEGREICPNITHGGRLV